ncbi:hypothetical protein RFI_23833 [Reticulomyxa filosa]|uniref:Phosphoglycerate mutase family protein n=1 Tax=Reticulomyxa filosa TaxID=46433 RepID=X6MJC2_RETFI|nr:hypothetical protein RFI_23833 [Reticulomyxa filosa]|eukprot:ETO13537.1 hypothetical protein RFI_23833 [Reticulomyxa filosa]
MQLFLKNFVISFNHYAWLVDPERRVKKSGIYFDSVGIAHLFYFFLCCFVCHFVFIFLKIVDILKKKMALILLSKFFKVTTKQQLKKNNNPWKIKNCSYHAENNPLARGKQSDTKKSNDIDGYFASVTDIDSELSAKGTTQARKLHKKIEEAKKDMHEDKRLDLRNAQLVITSPLTRAIRTGLIALPIEKEEENNITMCLFIVFLLVFATIQVENTTDIGRSPKELIPKFPALETALSQLPDAWWWRHPLLKGEPSDPRRDADWLRQCQGLPPARESDENVKQRLRHFLHWLIPLQHNRHRPLRNVVMVSHSCTLKFFEQVLHEIGINNNGNGVVVSPKNVYFENTEVRSYEMPTLEEWQQHLNLYPLSSSF